MRRRIVRRPRVGTLVAALLVAVALTAAQVVSAGAQTSGVTVSVTSSLNPSTYGQAITFTASVSGLGGLLGQGTVQFQVDGANAGSAQTVTLGGTATYSTSSLGGGTHTVTANYSSTGGNGSGTLAGGQVVKPAATTLKLSSSANPAPVGSSIILTATIAVTAPGAGSPDGSVSFVSGNASLGTVNASGGQAYLTVYSGTLPGGTDSITAAYAGNANFSGSSSTLSQVVAGTGTGSPQPSPSTSTKPTPTPSKASPKPTPTKTPSAAPTPSPTASPTFVLTPTPSFTFVEPTFPTAAPLGASPSPSASGSSSSSKLPLVGLIVIILVIIVAVVIVTLRRRRLGL